MSAIKDLYRGDGGPLSDYNQGWNDGVEAAEKALRAERDVAVEALTKIAEWGEEWSTLAKDTLREIEEGK